MTWPRTEMPWFAPELMAEREASAAVDLRIANGGIRSEENPGAALWLLMLSPDKRVSRALSRWSRANLVSEAAVLSWNGAKVEG